MSYDLCPRAHVKLAGRSFAVAHAHVDLIERCAAVRLEVTEVGAAWLLRVARRATAVDSQGESVTLTSVGNEVPGMLQGVIVKVVDKDYPTYEATLAVTLTDPAPESTDD